MTENMCGDLKKKKHSIKITNNCSGQQLLTERLSYCILKEKQKTGIKVSTGMRIVHLQSTLLCLVLLEGSMFSTFMLNILAVELFEDSAVHLNNPRYIFLKPCYPYSN